MTDVLAIHPGGGSQVFVNPITSSSETIVINNDGAEQIFTTPSATSVILSPNPIVVSTDPSELAALQTQMAQAMTAITNQATLIATLQSEQAADIPVQRLEYTPSSPASTWTITHNFGYIPSVEVYINGSEVFTDTSSTNSVSTIVFPSPQTGVAVLT